VSLDAVKFHVANAIGKLGLTSRDDLRTWRGVPADSTLRTTEANGSMTTGSSLRLGPIGQVSRPVTDIERAVHWYGTVLGLPHLYTYGDLAFFDCGGTRLFLSAAPEGGPPGAPSVLYFRVDDIGGAYEQLLARGVVFRGAPHRIHRHADGLEEWMAFFDDPDGHPLAIMAQVPASG